MGKHQNNHPNLTDSLSLNLNSHRMSRYHQTSETDTSINELSSHKTKLNLRYNYVDAPPSNLK